MDVLIAALLADKPIASVLERAGIQLVVHPSSTDDFAVSRVVSKGVVELLENSLRVAAQERSLCVTTRHVLLSYCALEDAEGERLRLRAVLLEEASESVWAEEAKPHKRTDVLDAYQNDPAVVEWRHEDQQVTAEIADAVANGMFERAREMRERKYRRRLEVVIALACRHSN